MKRWEWITTQKSKQIWKVLIYNQNMIPHSLITATTPLFIVLIVGFTTLFNILGHQRHSDIEREKSDKFCSEALISAWGSITCRKCTIPDQRLYFHSKGSHTQVFYALKKSIDPDRDRTREPGSRGKYDNHLITGVNTPILTTYLCYNCLKTHPHRIKMHNSPDCLLF